MVLALMQQTCIFLTNLYHLKRSLGRLISIPIFDPIHPLRRFILRCVFIFFLHCSSLHPPFSPPSHCDYLPPLFSPFHRSFIHIPYVQAHTTSSTLRCYGTLDGVLPGVGWGPSALLQLENSPLSRGVSRINLLQHPSPLPNHLSYYNYPNR